MNTIIIHLESISMIHLQQFQELYYKLYNLPIKRIWFNNFYSTSTSTIMAIADVLSGDMSKYETSISSSRLKDSKPHILSLNKVIPNSKALFYPPFWSSSDLFSLKQLFPNFELFGSYSCFRNEIRNYLNKYNDFTLFIYDGSSSLAMLENAEINNESYLEQWYKGKLRTIETVYFVIECLFASKLQDKVQLVIYGDHGNDFLTHKSGRGHTHCFEPYNDLTHVPLIYYHPRLDNQHVEKVFSMKNLYALIINGLCNNADNNNFTQFLYEQESFAFARNLYSMQSEAEIGLKKAYSITDGTYSLIVSSSGVEMYANSFDPTNHCNLLTYFTMQTNGMLVYKVSKGMSKQFSYVINEKRAREIINEYIILKSKLYEAIKEVSRDANKFLFEELDFNTINHI
ncbi:hypothetical protein [Lacrimispora algidixylanolytica]|uniref:Sulfatase N-terminal domain-containing protein n=1 Tax=Lacrimispora algidixylanolytica TaxID=94868 RepID=A0A419T2L0_9FIRM|nr:hypothetical protein [Lacrimispora algidixylanolytica]RKD31747.1 hypothetical protein BET01_19705 [Lacrimispora algidixylanolytica]